MTISRRDLDVIRALRRVRQSSRKIGLTSFGGSTSGIDLMAEVLNVDIRPIDFHTTPELVAGISKAIEDGYRCIVGGGICRKIAESVGSEGFVVVPGERVIQQALAEARVIAETQRRNREEAERLRVILHSVKVGVVGINSSGNIDLINPIAAEMLRVNPARILNRAMPETIRGTGLHKVLETGEADVDQFRRVNGVDMIISAMPVTVSENTRAVVATFTRASRIQDLDRKLKERVYTKGFVARYSLADLRGTGTAMQRLREKAGQDAATDATVLIQGETGTGKEILAQGIHAASSRRDRPFVAVNCSTLPDTLLESELFCYEEGAFTGAKRGGKQGLFELATGGTLFLDELADIAPSLQVRLLRAIEEKDIMRVGGDRIIPVDVRIITSTYKDLAQEARAGRFRADLYFRIATLKLHSVPLRERVEDVEIIMASLLERYPFPSGLSPLPLSKEVHSRMAGHSWPGNVRELDSLVQRFSALAGVHNRNRDPQALLMEIIDELIEEALPLSGTSAVTDNRLQEPLRQQLRRRELEIIGEALRQTEDNKAEAARRLGISVNSLWRKLREE